MDLTWLASAGAFAVSMSATPGPNNAMLTASGATWGFRRTVPHMLGITLGFPAMVVIVALGAGEAFRAQPWLHEALRWIGAAYLLWLAWCIAMARPDAAADEAGGRPFSLMQAGLFQWVNPKAWAVALGAVVTFTSQAGLLVEAAVLALIFLAVTPPVAMFWTLVGVGAARVLRTRSARRWFNRAMAALLVASLVPTLL